VRRSRYTGFGLGMAIHRFQDDFGAGLVVASPTFAKDMFRFTLGGGIAFFPHGVKLGPPPTEEWVMYEHARLLLEVGRRMESAPIRLYAFGGPQVLVVPSDLRADAFAIGGIGGFGFEFFFTDSGVGQSFFIELGGVGTGVTADKLPGAPSFHNGFVATVGFRIFP